MSNKNTNKRYLLPEIIFKNSAEVIDDLYIIKLAMDGGMPIAFTFEKRERFIEPKFIFRVDGKDYLIGFDVENEILCSFALKEINMVFMVQGEAKQPLLDILSGTAHFCLNPNSKDLQKLLKNRMAKRAIIKKKECCSPKAGQKVIGEVDEDGNIIVHSCDCAKAKEYWWG